MVNRLEDSRVLVVGCHSEVAAGITKAIAESNVAHIVGTYLEGDQDTGATLEAVRSDVSSLTDFTSMQLDVTDVDQITDVIRRAQETMGGLDMLVTAAASQCDDVDYMDMTPAQIQRQIAINLTGPQLIIRDAAKRMMELHDSGNKRHRAICAVASVRATEPLDAQGYDSSKAGIVQHIRAMAGRLGPFGIKTGAILPGTVDVALEPLRHECPPEEYRRRWADLTPLGGTPVTPALVGEATVELMNSVSSTGEVRYVDGGYHNERPLPSRTAE